MDALAPISARETEMRKQAALNASSQMPNQASNRAALQQDMQHVDSGFVGEFRTFWISLELVVERKTEVMKQRDRSPPAWTSSAKEGCWRKK